MYNCLLLWYNMASSVGTANEIPEALQINVFDPSGPSCSTSTAYHEPELQKCAVRKIYVGNLSPKTSSKDLRDCFSAFGIIQNAHLAKLGSGVKPSYGFVTFYDPPDAATAINVGRDGSISLHGRHLIINEADQRHQPRELPNGRIVWNVKSLRPFFSTYRRINVDIDESKCVVHLLNDDCLRLIFSLLPKRDIIKCERVCKRWQTLCRDMWLSSKELTFSNLDLRKRYLTMHIVNELFERCGPNLVSVDLSYKPSDLQSSVLTLIAESCPSLCCLNLSNVPLSSSGLKAIGFKCPELRQVTLEFCFGVKDRDIHRFFHMCKKLETVNLSHNNSLTGKCLEGLNKENMKDLFLSNCNLHSDVIKDCLASFSNLRSLNIDSCVNLTSKDVSVLFHSLPQLKSLSMSQYYPNISQETFKTISELKELVVLNISHNNSITDDVLTAIVKGCKKIESINITGCSINSDHGGTVSDAGIAAVAKLPQLLNLKMSYMALATDLSLVAIAENSSKIQTIECRGCPSFNDFGCSRVVTLCNELRQFDFSGCDDVTDNTVRAAIAAVKLRTNNASLRLITGGTMVSMDYAVEPGLLTVDNENLCAQHLRPDFVDNHYFLSESDDDDDFENLYDVDFDVVGSPAMFFGDDLGEYYGYLAFMEGGYNNSEYEFEDDDDDN